MESKLTLKINKRTIERGILYAKKRNTSLSKMIENYLEKITQTSEDEISPLVRSLSGLLKGENIDYKKDYASFLKKKYQ